MSLEPGLARVVGTDLRLEQPRVVHTSEVPHIPYRPSAGAPPAESNQQV